MLQQTLETLSITQNLLLHSLGMNAVSTSSRVVVEYSYRLVKASSHELSACWSVVYVNAFVIETYIAPI